MSKQDKTDETAQPDDSASTDDATFDDVPEPEPEPEEPPVVEADAAPAAD